MSSVTRYDPVGWFLLRVFPLAMCASRAFHRFIVRDQLGEDHD